MGGRVQKASGATDFAKGDVKTNELRVECKTTTKKTYSISLQEIQKIQSEAISGNFSDWAMQIEFHGQMGMHKKVAVIDWDTYLHLQGRL